MKACVSLASWPGLSAGAAMALARSAADPLFGSLSLDRVQLVPQSMGVLTCEVAQALRAGYPDTQFRLHANVRVLPQHRPADLAGFDEHRDWFVQAAAVSRLLRAPAYTAHAGRRRQSSLTAVFDNLHRVADLFGCTVGVEGLYPSPREDWLLSTWLEYRALLEAGVPFALDLSHLHILATRSRTVETNLVRELLASEHCIEVHVSHNDGLSDLHRVCPASPPWWFDHLLASKTRAVVFSEGCLRRSTSKEFS